MLQFYLICKSCESLFSPDFETCPVCGTPAETENTPGVFHIMRYRVCCKCSCLVPEHIDNCPFCETPLNSPYKPEIVEQPVEFTKTSSMFSPQP